MDRQRVPAPNALQLDRLTEWADLLLANGCFAVYDTPKERLLLQADQELARLREAMTGAAGVGGSGGGEGDGQAVDDVDMFGSEEEGSGGQQQQQQQQQQRKGSGGETEPPQQQQQQQQQHSQRQAATAASPTADAEMRDGEAVALLPAAGAAAAAARAANGSQMQIMQGFVFDESSGYFWSSELNYYFDPATQLFGDTAGAWYAFVDGQYRAVAGNGGAGAAAAVEAGGGSGSAAAQPAG